MGTDLGGVAHPLQGVDVLAEGGAEVLHEGDHLLLGGFREVALHVHLAHRLAEEAVRDAHRTLPAGTLLLGTGHLVGEELPGSGVEVVGQGSALTGDELGEEISLQGLEIGVLEDLVQAVEVAGLLNDHLVLRRDVAGGAHAAETDFGPAGVDFRGAHRVVDGLHVAVLLTGPEDGSHGVLHLHVLGGDSFRIVHAREGQGLHQEVLVPLLEGSVGLQEIVVAVAHAQAALAQVEDLHLAVGEVRLHAGAEEAAFAVEVHLADEVRQGVLGIDRQDLGDVGLDRLRAQGVPGRGVEGHLIQVGNLLVDGAGLGLERGHVLKELVQVLLGGLRDGVEGAVTGEFGFEGVLLLPTAGGVLVEIHFRTGGGVQVRQVQCRGMLLAALRAASGKRAKGNHKDR